MAPAIFRVILSVDDIERAAEYYTRLLGAEGRRVSSGWHYFDAGQVILACHDPAADGDDTPFCPNPEPIFFIVPNVDTFFRHCVENRLVAEHASVKTQSSGERCVYMQDPFGNPLCFVDAPTRFTGDLRIGGLQLT